jgi:hypothetical protein
MLSEGVCPGTAPIHVSSLTLIIVDTLVNCCNPAQILEAHKAGVDVRDYAEALKAGSRHLEIMATH